MEMRTGRLSASTGTETQSSREMREVARLLARWAVRCVTHLRRFPEMPKRVSPPSNRVEDEKKQKARCHPG